MSISTIVMGRRRLYHTPEEARLAANAKSRKSYHKNKGTIRSRRQEDYNKRKEEKQQLMRPRPQFGPKKSTPIDVDRAEPVHSLADRDNPQRVTYWVRRVERVSKRFAEEVGPSPLAYAEELYAGYVATHRNEPIFEAIVRMEKFQKWLTTYLHEILQISGCSAEYKCAQEVAEKVSAMHRSLEDLGLYTTLSADDIPDFETLHKRKEFAYQTLLTA
ncbi:hypothetical protein H0H93_005328 [Arthromyces matolae]|nr:hypothetical protein H0H93_005328 [Arthromyces matolae]